MHGPKKLIALVLIAGPTWVGAHFLQTSHRDIVPAAKGLNPSGEYQLVSQRHLLNDVPARASKDLINVVVEIPAGTNGKWEVVKESGNLQWQIVDGKPRVVQY